MYEEIIAGKVGMKTKQVTHLTSKFRKKI